MVKKARRRRHHRSPQSPLPVHPQGEGVECNELNGGMGGICTFFVKLENMFVLLLIAVIPELYWEEL